MHRVRDTKTKQIEAVRSRPSRTFLAFLGVGVFMLAARPVWASSGGSHMDSPVPSVVAALAVILAIAKLGGHAAVRVGQPAILGELVAGVVLGSVDDLGVNWFRSMETDPGVDVIANLGVLILLFEVGLESTIKDMLKVGLSSLLVAVLGVVMPFALGWGVAALMLSGRGSYVHAFLGATLTATSVGITARVLKDLNRSQSPEARVILGAAVIDDVLGLVILALVGGLITAADRGESLSLLGIGVILGKALAFLIGSLLLGLYLSPRMFGLASKLRGGGVLLGSSLAFCFALAYVASTIGLAPIIGAYAAGLILDDVHFRGFSERGVEELETLVHPISTFLAPVFFVLIGMRVELTAFARVDVLGLAALLTVAAVLGKQACALGVVGRDVDRLSVAIGMTPRGEVGIIFANIGLGLSIAGRRVVDDGIFSAVTIVVILTTMATPPALKWSLSRRDRARPPPPRKRSEVGATE